MNLKTKQLKSLNSKKATTVATVILSAVAVVIIIVILSISATAKQNVTAMNECVDAVLATLKESYNLTPVDVGDYEELRIYGIMKFDVEQYDIEELGNLSIMRMNMGLMQMATVVITPQDKNMPLLSADYMYILSNRKAYLEFYDVVAQKDDAYNNLLSALAAVKGNYAHLEDIEVSEAWYKDLLTVTSYKGGKADADTDLKGILTDSLAAYLDHASALPLLSADERVQKLDLTVAYTDGLIANGGISTDVFKKELGPEETKYFFDHIFFGTAK